MLVTLVAMYLNISVGHLHVPCELCASLTLTTEHLLLLIWTPLSLKASGTAPSQCWWWTNWSQPCVTMSQASFRIRRFSPLRPVGIRSWPSWRELRCRNWAWRWRPWRRWFQHVWICPRSMRMFSASGQRSCQITLMVCFVSFFFYQ